MLILIIYCDKTHKMAQNWTKPNFVYFKCQHSNNEKQDKKYTILKLCNTPLQRYIASMVFVGHRKNILTQPFQNDNFMIFLVKIVFVYMAWLPWKP